MIAVAIIDDHPAIREWFAQVVEQADGLALACAEPSTESFDCRIKAWQADARPAPDVVVLDLSLAAGRRDGAAGVAHLVCAGFAVLVLSASENRDAVVSAIEAGARGYVTKAAQTSEILTAIREVAAGNVYVSPTLASYLLRASMQARTSALTDREQQILALIATGMTDKEIAIQLGISVRTVRSHLDNVGNKLGERRRAALASQAHRLGLTPPELTTPEPNRRSRAGQGARADWWSAGPRTRVASPSRSPVGGQ
jgi:DNA-binding NarL/FixJ family response regulator